MNKDRVKGKIDKVVGSANRKTGKLTHNGQLQVEGMAQQVKGKIESAFGEVKDAVQQANKEARGPREPRVYVKPDASKSPLISTPVSGRA
jgi:uncharacterized protein YjbJ (UPF0337 family)